MTVLMVIVYSLVFGCFLNQLMAKGVTLLEQIGDCALGIFFFLFGMRLDINNFSCF